MSGKAQASESTRAQWRREADARARIKHKAKRAADRKLWLKTKKGILYRKRVNHATLQRQKVEGPAREKYLANHRRFRARYRARIKALRSLCDWNVRAIGGAA